MARMKQQIAYILVMLGLCVMLVAQVHQTQEAIRDIKDWRNIAAMWRDIARACEHSQITIANHETH